MKVSLPTGKESPESKVQSPESGRGTGDVGLLAPWVRAITSAGEMQLLNQAAAADEHRVIGATHLIERPGAAGRGTVIGYGSIGGAMLVNVWVQTGGVKPRESLMLMNMAENVAALKGAQIICMPCGKESPFRPYMERFGYDYAGETGMFLKRLKA